MHIALIIIIIIILVIVYFYIFSPTGINQKAASGDVENVNKDETFISPYSIVYNHGSHGDGGRYGLNRHFDRYDDKHSPLFLSNTYYHGAWPYNNARNTRYNRRQGREIVVINNGPQRSSYNIYDWRQANMPGSWPGRKEILVRLHYTAWNPKSKFIWPIWQRLKDDLAGVDGNKNLILFEEIDEQVAKTDGINRLPMIIKYKDGVAYTYEGPPEYTRMREWIMSSTDSRMYYFYPRR